MNQISINQTLKNMKKNNFLTKAFTLLFVLLFNLTGARAIVTHTAYPNGTETSTIVPVQGSQVGSALIRSQFIIPSTQLEIMAGGKITNMYFHAAQDVVNWYREANFYVYVKEVDEEVFTETGSRPIRILLPDTVWYRLPPPTITPMCISCWATAPAICGSFQPTAPIKKRL